MIWQITGDPEAILPFLGVISLLAFSLILRELSYKYVTKCIIRGLEEYTGRSPRVTSRLLKHYSFWERVYWFYLRRRTTLGLIVEAPFTTVNSVLLVIVFTPMAISIGVYSIWLLFPLWFITLFFFNLRSAYARFQEIEREFQNRTQYSNG